VPVGLLFSRQKGNILPETSFAHFDGFPHKATSKLIVKQVSDENNHNRRYGLDHFFGHIAGEGHFQADVIPADPGSSPGGIQEPFLDICFRRYEGVAEIVIKLDGTNQIAERFN